MTNNNIFKMWFLFFVIIIFAMPRHICFADNNRVVSGDYIWVMDGSSSIYLAVKVKVDIEDTKLLLFVDKVKEPVIILNVINNEVKGRITGDDGDYSISGKIKSNSEIKGEFNFKVSEKGVKNEFMNDDGTFLLIPYTQQKLIKYQECVNERLYRIDMHESLEEMAKRSPWARKHLKQREKDRGSQENPIVFYGKAIDQFGHPVADAEIKYSIKIYTLIVWSKDNVKDYDTKSDDNGLFTIKEHKGRSLDIRTITKNGFRGLFANKDFASGQSSP